MILLLNKKKKLEEENKTIDVIKLQIKERLDEYIESSKEEQKELYTQIITLKKNIFDFLKPKLSIVSIIPNTQLFDNNVEYITLVTDYLPVHNNEQPITNKEIESASEVEIIPEELE